MTEGQRVKLEYLIECYEAACYTTCNIPQSMTYQMAQDNRRKALKDITDHLSTIQRFGKAQTMLIKVYADELNSDSEDLLHKYRRSLEKSAR